MLALVVVLVACLAIGTPIGVALLAAGIAGIYALGLDFRAIPMRMFNGMDSFLLLAVPAFLFAGEIMVNSGIMRRVLQVLGGLIRNVRGGSAFATSLANLLMAGVSGSPAADTAAIGKLMIPSMLREGYHPGYAASVVAATSIVVALIPPSVLFIVAASVSGVSVIDLFIAGILPGLLIIAIQMLVILFQARRYDLPVPERVETTDGVTFVKNLFIIGLIPGVILTGLRLGLFTPTEAAGFAAVTAILIGFFITRELTIRELIQSARSSLRLSANVYLIIAGASCCAYVLAAAGINQKIAGLVAVAGLTPTAVVYLSYVVILIAGLFLEPMVIILLCLPMFLPYVNMAGISPVVYVIALTTMACIGLSTPPVAVCLSIACGIANTTILSTVRFILPLIAAAGLVVILITLFPAIVTMWI